MSNLRRQISPGYITIAEAVITFLGFPALIGGAYAVDKGLFRKRKVMPSPHCEIKEAAAASAEATPPDASCASSDVPPVPPGDAPPTDAPSKPQGSALDRLKRKTKEIVDDMDSSFHERNGEDQGKAPSTTMIVARWGLSAGALNDAQFRELQLAHLHKT